MIKWEDSRILTKESNVAARRIRESIEIRKKGRNTMNRDDGAHLLSHLYDPLLTRPNGTTPSRDEAPVVRRKDYAF